MQKMNFQKALLSWYHKHKRDLPWRKTRDPYAIWISEIMLQQTQVATVIDYYHRFLKKFPNIKSLAHAKEEEVLALWSGLGYYSRARNLQAAAKKILQEHQGKFPEDPDAILALPGIGRYTLGAIASIAFDQVLPLVDGNVIRVYSRFFALKGSPSDTKFVKKIWGIAEEIISSLSQREVRRDFKLKNPPQSPFTKGEENPGDFNQALMELGATVCTPKNPLCLLCPLTNSCRVRVQDPENYPEKKKRTATTFLTRHVALIQRNEKVLLSLPQKTRWQKGLWQLPGFFIEKEKKNSDTNLDALLHGLGLQSSQIQALKAYTHQITHHRITVIPHKPLKWNGKVKKDPQNRLEWVPRGQLAQLALPAIDRKIIEENLA